MLYNMPRVLGPDYDSATGASSELVPFASGVAAVRKKFYSQKEDG